MTLTILKVSFTEQKQRDLNYCKYILYDNTILRGLFLIKPNHVNVSKEGNSLNGFQETCLTVLHSMGSIKSKFTWKNQTSFMNKELQRAIMIKS